MPSLSVESKQYLTLKQKFLEKGTNIHLSMDDSLVSMKERESEYTAQQKAENVDQICKDLKSFKKRTNKHDPQAKKASFATADEEDHTTEKNKEPIFVAFYKLLGTFNCLMT